jgi:hypothetical protein
MSSLSALSHGIAFSDVASAADDPPPEQVVRSGLTGLGAAAYPGPSVRTLRRALACALKPLCCTRPKSDSK